MPLNELNETKALLTLEEARLFVVRDAADRSRDELLIDAINDVSESIWDYCRREFLPTDSATPRKFAYDGQGWLDLAPYDLRDLDEITLYTDRDTAQQVLLDDGQFKLMPVGGSAGGTWLSIVLPYPAVEERDYGFGWEVTVTGDWGMAAVPGAVRLAAKQWVENLVKNPGSYAAANYNGFQVFPAQDDTPALRAGMPPAVRHRLERWRRKNRSSLSSVRLANQRWAPSIPHTLPTV